MGREGQSDMVDPTSQHSEEIEHFCTKLRRAEAPLRAFAQRCPFGHRSGSQRSHQHTEQSSSRLKYSDSMSGG